MTAGIILAAGKGTRLNSKTINKVALPFSDKPMISYGVDLLENFCSPLILVVGAYAQSVKDVLRERKIVFAHQAKRLGTGHAVVCGMRVLSRDAKTEASVKGECGMRVLKKNPPSHVLVGYGDHLMFYRKKTIVDFLRTHKKKKAAVSLITTSHTDPNTLCWGRIIRDKKGFIRGIVEQKDATRAQRSIQELNAGFYCFDYSFLKGALKKIKKSPVSGEYYLTDVIALAVSGGNIIHSLKVPFSEVGIGVNRKEELEAAQKFFRKRKG